MLYRSGRLPVNDPLAVLLVEPGAARKLPRLSPVVLLLCWPARQPSTGQPARADAERTCQWMHPAVTGLTRRYLYLSYEHGRHLDGQSGAVEPGAGRKLYGTDTELLRVCVRVWVR